MNAQPLNHFKSSSNYLSFDLFPCQYQDEEDDEGAVGHEYHDDPSYQASFAAAAAMTSSSMSTSTDEAMKTGNLLGDDFNDDIPETADLLGS